MRLFVPCCQLTRRYGNLKNLRAWNEAFYKHSSIVSDVESGFINWACDTCIKKGDAIIGKPDKQDLGAFGPTSFAYFDKILNCSACRKDFTFSKEEQQFWYESLGFIVYSKPKHCNNCRKRKRVPKLRNTRISNLVRTLNKHDFDQIESLVLLYLQIKKLEKAKYYLALGKKSFHRTKNYKVKRRLEELSHLILILEGKQEITTPH